MRVRFNPPSGQLLSGYIASAESVRFRGRAEVVLSPENATLKEACKSQAQPLNH